MGISYIVGSVFPLIAYFFFPIGTAFPVSIGVTIIALAVVGFIRARTARISMPRSILEVVLVGTGSAAGGYFLGSLVPRSLGQ